MSRISIGDTAKLRNAAKAVKHKKQEIGIIRLWLGSHRDGVVTEYVVGFQHGRCPLRFFGQLPANCLATLVAVPLLGKQLHNRHLQAMLAEGGHNYIPTIKSVVLLRSISSLILSTSSLQAS